MTRETCGFDRCTSGAAGYVDPGRRDGPLEVYVGQRDRPDQVPVCAGHLAEASKQTRMTRKDLLRLQWPTRYSA